LGNQIYTGFINGRTQLLQQLQRQQRPAAAGLTVHAGGWLKKKVRSQQKIKTRKTDPRNIAREENRKESRVEESKRTGKNLKHPTKEAQERKRKRKTLVEL